jgi:hypothetical protein
MRRLTALLMAGAVAAGAASAATRWPLRLWQTAAEKAAIRAAFALQSAEIDYAVRNGGFFDPPSCLFAPTSCLPEYAGTPFLNPDFDAAARSAGYAWTFIPGRAADRHDAAQPRSPDGRHSYAFVGKPSRAAWFGPRPVCVDSSARVCVGTAALRDASDGLCPAACDRSRASQWWWAGAVIPRRSARFTSLYPMFELSR